MNSPKSRFARKNLYELSWMAVIVACVCLSTQVLFGAHQAATGTQAPQNTATPPAAHPVEGETFDTAQQAADALIAAAGTFDEAVTNLDGIEFIRADAAVEEFTLASLGVKGPFAVDFDDGYGEGPVLIADDDEGACAGLGIHGDRCLFLGFYGET